MAGTHSIRVDLPAELFEQIREAATRSDQPMESVLIDSLALVFGTPRSGWEPPTETLEALPDAQLWALVYRGMAWQEGARLRELTARGKQAVLSSEEQAELAALIDEADRLMLLRSRALLALRQRGHNIEKLLQPGV
jgi:hypothetical protein